MSTPTTTTTTAPTSTPSLTPDEIDDLIYYTRTNDLAALKPSFSALLTAYPSTTVEQILIAAAAAATTPPSPPHHQANQAENPSEPVSSGWTNTLLHYAAANGHTELLSYLLSLLTTDKQDLQLQPHQRASGCQSKLLNWRNASGNTALHWAAVNGRVECVQALVEAGADPMMRNGVGRDVVGEAEMAAVGGLDGEGAAEVVQWLVTKCGVRDGGGVVNEDGMVDVGNGNGDEEVFLHGEDAT